MLFAHAGEDFFFGCEECPSQTVHFVGERIAEDFVGDDRLVVRFGANRRIAENLEEIPKDTARIYCRFFDGLVIENARWDAGGKGFLEEIDAVSIDRLHGVPHIRFLEHLGGT